MATASGSEPTGVTWYGPNCVPEAMTPAGTIASSDSNVTDAIANTEVRRRRVPHHHAVVALLLPCPFPDDGTLRAGYGP